MEAASLMDIGMESGKCRAVWSELSPAVARVCVWTGVGLTGHSSGKEARRSVERWISLYRPGCPGMELLTSN